MKKVEENFQYDSQNRLKRVCWTTITDENGEVQQRLNYDPWGNLRDPDTWANYTPNDVFNKPMFDRGYTGHEHLSAFGLINRRTSRRMDL